MNLGLVVSTLGRAEPLERLLRSLAPQVAPDDRIVLVAQANRDAVERLAERFREAGVAIDVTTSERGASRGRNAGVAALPAGERLLHFPNDTTWFPDGSVAAIRGFIRSEYEPQAPLARCWKRPRLSGPARSP